MTEKPQMLPGIDTQVLTAALELDFSGKTNPAWAFIDQDANQMSFGRWARCGRNPAPYIRADIVLAALADATPPAEVVEAMERALRAFTHGYLFQTDGIITAFHDAEIALVVLEVWRDSQRPPSEYEQKLAAMKKDFPNGI